MRYGIYLSGGGYSGAGQGKTVATIVRRINKWPEVIRAVSVGAFTGACLVEHDLDDGPVNDIWINCVQARGPGFVFPKTPEMLWRFLTLQPHLFSDKGLYHLTGLLDMEKICDPKSCRIEVRVFNVLQKKPETHSNHDPEFRNNPELFRSFIRASARLPGIFQPEEINGVPYCDAIMGSTIALFTKYGCDLVFAAVNDPIDYDISRVLSWWIKLRGVPHIVTDSILEDEKETFGNGLVIIRPRKRTGRLSRTSFRREIKREVEIAENDKGILGEGFYYGGDIAREIIEAEIRTNKALDELRL